MRHRLALAIVVFTACGGKGKTVQQPKLDDRDAVDPDGPHKDAVAAQVKPYIDADIASGIVVGIYDGGKREIYGFGNGPGGKPPDGHTLFEIGSVTKVYTCLLLADAVQRREVELETPLSSLLPPGVTAPTKDKVEITLAHLALHNSGLPRLPPTIAASKELADPYAKYTEDNLYADLVHTPLAVAPGEAVSYSNFGVGVLGFVLGKKIGPGYGKALVDRVLGPLELKDTSIGVPEKSFGRRAVGTDDDLVAVPSWHFTDALAGAGALVSTARDQLALLDAEIDAAAGGSQGALRRAMRFTQEAQLQSEGSNEGLGWQIDPQGRLWHNGGTGGFHSFVGFDPKTKRGVVILASTASTLIDRLADTMYTVLDGTAKEPPKFATGAMFASLAGRYSLEGEELAILAAGNRLYIDGKGEPRHRLVPISDHEFFIEALQAVAVFEREGDVVKRLIFVVNGHQFSADRVATE